MLAAVIFDVDGVLVDSYQAHFESWKALGQARGVRIDHEAFAETFGQTSRDIIRRFWGDEPGTEAEILELDARKEALYRRIVAASFPAMAGAGDLVTRLREAGLRLAVGSSGPPENVALALERLGSAGAFEAVVHGLEVTRGKPDPEVFLTAASRLRIDPRRCLVIEDAPDGIVAAHAAGMSAVALLSTGRRRSALAAARPERIVSSLFELSPELLRTIHTAARHPDRA